MGPYTKTWSKAAIDDGWKITDGTGEAIAYLDTNLLADVMMNWLVNGGDPPPDFTADEPYGEEEDDDDPAG